MINHLKEDRGHLVRIIILAFVIALAFWVSGAVKDSEFVGEVFREFGYVGIFLVAVVSGFNLVIPVPAISFLPIFLASGLNAVAVIAIIAAGMTLADFIGFLLGKAGRSAAEVAFALSRRDRSLAGRILRWIPTKGQSRHRGDWSPALALFLFASFIPLPNEVLVVPMAFLGYRFSYILLPVFFGNMVFNSLYAVGVVNILKLL